MTTTAELADFLAAVSYDELPEPVREETQKRLFDSVGVAIGAVGEEQAERVHDTVTTVSTDGPATLWGYDRSASIPAAAMLNATLTRSLDVMDSFLAPGETAHPSDAVAPIVACGEAVGASGMDLITAIAAAYEVQGELAWNAPVRDRGFDGVTHSVVAGAAGAAKILDLDREATRNAIAIAGTGHNALRVTGATDRTTWSPVASGTAARNGADAALLADNAVAGPVDCFEGPDGWEQVISGEFSLDLDPRCPRVRDVATRRYVGAAEAQSAVEACVELSRDHYVDPAAVTRITLTTFEGAARVDGEDSRHEGTRSGDDRSLPSVLAAAVLECRVTAGEYDPDRVRRADGQDLRQCVEITVSDELTDRFERGELPAVVEIELTTGDTLRAEKAAFAGHPNDPMDWEQLREKFANVTGDAVGPSRCEEIERIVRTLEDCDVAALVDHL